MAYKSNLTELPELTRYLLQERRASKVEIRYTFNFEHIDQGFRSSEFLDAEDWLWLREELRPIDDGRISVIFPSFVELPFDRHGLDPVENVEKSGENAQLVDVRYFLPARYQIRLQYDGSMEVQRQWACPYDQSPPRQVLAELNINDIKDPLAFLAELPA